VGPEKAAGKMQVLRLRGCAASLRMTDLFFILELVMVPARMTRW
jgi:hypothetical protein